MSELRALFLTADAELFNFCRVPFSDGAIEPVLARDFKDVLRLAAEFPSAVLVADCKCPDVARSGGAEQFFRKARQSAPGLVLVGLVESGTPTPDVVALLKAGANDVVAKPLRPRVFAEQVKALARLQAKAFQKKARTRLSSKIFQLQLDVPARRCHLKISDGGVPKRMEIRLTRAEFAIVEMLLEKKHKLVSYDDFRRRLWPQAGSVGEVTHTLLTHITNIRRKFRGGSVKLDNLWGEGYRLD